MAEMFGQITLHIKHIVVKVKRFYADGQTAANG